ncbi:uncharacterized protein At4g19900 [Phoenix dactylifera]|uniref:Uncharacterized protein At4g19900 n=1 Tax=Phoenix dactylifera TaxID=42345 RepID=A0A8B7CT58_PHODC|nr:uncharacterized protein At4g19900 [Phoenix dactylifera]
MLRPHPARRRHAYGPQLCAASAALLILLSLFVLHSRLSSSPFPLGLGLRSVLPRGPDHSFSSDRAPLFDDADNDAFDGAADDRIDELDVLEEEDDQQRRRSAGEEDEILRAVGAGLDDDGDSDEPELPRTPRSGLFWDHALGVARQSFGKPDPRRPYDPWGDDAPPEELRPSDRSKIAFGSDDQPVDEDLRLKMDSIRRIEDALLLKASGGGGHGESPLREGWARWLEGKGDFLRRDKMLRSNLELLNPKNHPLLQDPDGPGLTVLTKGDKMIQRVLLMEMERTPFGKGGGMETNKGVERKTLNLEEKKRPQRVPDGQRKRIAMKEDRHQADGRRWGYFPGLDPHLTFSEFMDQFFQSGRCAIRVFMVWNSPPWTYGIRHQRGLESLLHHHRDACVVVFSETMELDFFRGFVKDGFKIAVAMPDLDELLKDTPTNIFASVWFEWRKTKHYPIHYSELIRLAVLYKYGGIYLDSDIIVLNPLHSLENSVGLEDQAAGISIFNGAVMAFRKHSPFVMECLREFHSTYDDALLRWNGADLLTRVINKFSAAKSYRQLHIKIEPPFKFYPISSMNITRYFMAPTDDSERAQQDALLTRMQNESITFHFWNGLTSALVPEPNSLVERLLNGYCLRCSDVL